MEKIKQTIAYVYKWTHIPTLNWYIGSKPHQTGKNNNMNNPGVRAHHQQQVLAAMQRDDVKKRHAAGCEESHNRPEVRAASSKRMKEFCARPEVKAAKSIRTSGDNNPSRKYVLTCPKCNLSMAIGMYVRWKHGEQCQK